MKMTCIYTSPRKHGNSARVAGLLCSIAKADHISVSEYSLHDGSYMGCVSCNACKQTAEICVIQDDLARVLEVLPQTDLLVLALPVYCAGFNSSFMAFVERSTSFFKYEDSDSPEDVRLPRGKRLIVIQTQASSVLEENFFFAEYFTHLGFESQRFYCIDDSRIACQWSDVEKDVQGIWKEMA